MSFSTDGKYLVSTSTLLVLGYRTGYKYLTCCALLLHIISSTSGLVGQGSQDLHLEEGEWMYEWSRGWVRLWTVCCSRFSAQTHRLVRSFLSQQARHTCIWLKRWADQTMAHIWVAGWGSRHQGVAKVSLSLYFLSFFRESIMLNHAVGSISDFNSHPKLGKPQLLLLLLQKALSNAVTTKLIMASSALAQKVVASKFGQFLYYLQMRIRLKMKRTLLPHCCVQFPRMTATLTQSRRLPGDHLLIARKFSRKGRCIWHLQVVVVTMAWGFSSWH